MGLISSWQEEGLTGRSYHSGTTASNNHLSLKSCGLYKGWGGLHLLIAFNSTVVEQNGQFRIPGVPIHKDFRRASYTPM